jgi:hypothetical protein
VAAVAGLAVVGLAALLLSRDGGTDPKAIRHAIAVALEGQGMPAADATCVAERVVDTMGTKDLGKIDDFSASSVPDGLTKGFAADFAAALQAGAKACDASFGAD